MCFPHDGLANCRGVLALRHSFPPIIFRLKYTRALTLIKLAAHFKTPLVHRPLLRHYNMSPGYAVNQGKITVKPVKVTEDTGVCERTGAVIGGEGKTEKRPNSVCVRETADSTPVFICLVIRPLLLCMHNTGQSNLMKPLRSHKTSVSTAEYYQENIHY